MTTNIKAYMDLIGDMFYHDVDGDIIEKVKNVIVDKELEEKRSIKTLILVRLIRNHSLDALESPQNENVGEDTFSQVLKENIMLKKALTIIKDLTTEILE